MCIHLKKKKKKRHCCKICTFGDTSFRHLLFLAFAGHWLQLLERAWASPDTQAWIQQRFRAGSGLQGWAFAESGYGCCSGAACAQLCSIPSTDKAIFCHFGKSLVCLFHAKKKNLIAFAPWPEVTTPLTIISVLQLSLNDFRVISIPGSDGEWPLL